MAKYIDVLKESLSEADVTKTSDILGPMVEPILGYDGDGDLVTHKNASDILKKYYFENDSEGLVTLDDKTKTVTDGEQDQNKIDKVKKSVEDIINSDDETDKPTEKTLKEMVTNLEDILLGDDGLESKELYESDNPIANDIEGLLSEDVDVANKLENLLEEELDAGANGTKDEEEVDNEAGKDVIIDKDTKVKREADETDKADESDEVEDEEDDGDDEEEKTPLDVDKNIKEMDIIEQIISQDSLTNTELMLNNIENILDEQNEIVSYDSVAGDNSKDIEQDNDIDTGNPMHGKTVSESLEDSVLEWLIMEMESDTVTDEMLEESTDNSEKFSSDDLENEILKEAFSIFESDSENADINSDEVDDVLGDDFKVSKINSDDIRV